MRDVVPSDYARIAILNTTDGKFFCIYHKVYEKYQKKLVPLFGRSEIQWIESEEFEDSRSLIIIPSSDVESKQIRQKLGSILTYERRKGRLEKAEGHHLKEHYRTLWEIQEGKCYYSGEKLGDSFEKSKYNVDHIVPISMKWMAGDPGGMNGTNWPINLALLTPRVNRIKGGDDEKTFLRWVRQKKRFTPTPTKWRRMVDGKREDAFIDYMIEHSDLYTEVN